MALSRLSFESDLVGQIPRLQRYARALAGDHAWADDLVQDTVERALSRAGSFKVDTNLRAWLYTILRHLYLDQLRRHRTIAVDDQDELWQQLPVLDGEVDGLMLRDVQRALYSLPPEQREVLLLIGVEALSYREAAAVLGVPAGTIMSRLSRAREQMREWMEGGPSRKPSSLKMVSRK